MTEALPNTDRFPWTREALEILITNWENEPSLFDKSDKTYNAPAGREAAYVKIQTEIRQVYPGCQLSLDQVRSKIISLRCQYNRERRRLHKRTAGQPNGIGAVKSPWWYRRLNFLSNYIVTRRSKYECSLANSKNYLDQLHSARLQPAAVISMSHIPSSSCASFETDDSSHVPTANIAMTANSAATLFRNIKQENPYAEQHSDHDDGRYSYSGADDDNPQSESSVSAHLQNSASSQMQSMVDNGARIFQDSILHNTSNLLQSIRQFMDQSSGKPPITTTDSLQSFGQFLVASLAEIKDDHIVTEAQEACTRAIFAAKTAWNRKRKSNS